MAVPLVMSSAAQLQVAATTHILSQTYLWSEGMQLFLANQLEVWSLLIWCL